MEEYNISIDKREVLRYLGYKNEILYIDEYTENLLEECREEIKKIATPRNIFKRYDIEREEDKIKVVNTNFILEGKDIVNHLKYCKSCIFMAATLGIGVDRRINYYEKISMTKALVFNACAITLIEEYCDYIENAIREEETQRNNYITWRYSPGYGDLSLDIQKGFLTLLEGEKTIGLTATEHSLLIPRKSITAIIGITKRSFEDSHNKCERCYNNRNCDFKKVGVFCGY